MIRLLSDKIREHIISNIVSYIILTLFFSLGIISGAYIYNQYDTAEVEALCDFFTEAKEVYVNTGGSIGVFKNALFSSFKTIFLIWILGFTIIGIPVIFFTVFKKGFIFGLISNFLITNFSYGILTSIILFLVDAVILVPAIYVVSIYIISLSKTLIGMLTGKIRFKVNLKSYILFTAMNI